MKTIEWGFLIVCYLFLGGLSAGAFFISALATYLQHDNHVTPSEDAPNSRVRVEGPASTWPLQRIARWGALIAPWPVSIGSALLIFDLGHWYRFYKLFLHLRLVSPMSIGAWLLMLFAFVSLFYLWSWLSSAEKDWLFDRLPRQLQFLRRWDRDLAPWRRTLAAIGFPLSVGVGIYTGVLLGAVQSRPFWNTNLVAQLFLFSALSTGCAALILALSLSKQSVSLAEFRFLYTADIVLMVLEFFIVLPYLVHGELSVQAVKESLQLILGGPFTIAFWVFFFALGLALPLAFEIWEMLPAVSSRATLHYSRGMALCTAILVLMGGFLLRYVFVFAGQVSSFR
jgi:formate-dependent nitrite reductase membrane component NrfD